jgi:predicted SnoaL-like aldol condensation-catalyzing enzyme
MLKTTPEQNKAIVLEAFDTLFNKRDYEAAERFWSSKYIQHSAHIAPGREGLFALVRSTRYAALRKPTHCRRRRLRHRAWPFLRNRKTRSLDCG